MKKINKLIITLTFFGLHSPNAANIQVDTMLRVANEYCQEYAKNKTQEKLSMLKIQKQILSQYDGPLTEMQDGLLVCILTYITTELDLINTSSE